MGSFEDMFYKFPLESTWDFDCDFDGNKRRAVFTLRESHEDLSHIEFDLYNPPDPGATASLDYAWYIEDGFVVWGSYDTYERKKSPYWRIFKIGAVPGDTWETLPGVGQAKFVGSFGLIVPAGRYLETAHIILTDRDNKEHGFYYAAGTGLVRWDTLSSRGKGGYYLREFHLGLS